jgi:hypothetical protein
MNHGRWNHGAFPRKVFGERTQARRYVLCNDRPSAAGYIEKRLMKFARIFAFQKEPVADVT